MDKLLVALPALGCAIGMPLMMVLMMRGSRSRDATPRHDETAELRNEIAQLRDELAPRDDLAG